MRLWRKDVPCAGTASVKELDVGAMPDLFKKQQGGRATEAE